MYYECKKRQSTRSNKTLTKNVLNHMKDIINTHSQFLTNYYSKTSTKIVVLDILWKIGNYFERHKAYCNTKYLIWLYPYCITTNDISNDCKAYDIFHCYYKMRVILFFCWKRCMRIFYFRQKYLHPSQGFKDHNHAICIVCFHTLTKSITIIFSL